MNDGNPFSKPNAEEQPSSGFNIFGNSSMDEFGSSVPGLPSMNREGEPSVKDMEEAMEKVRYSKNVKVTSVHVKTFDLGVPKAVEEYTKLYVELYAKASESKILITKMDEQFIPCLTNPRWIKHLEWMEYDLQVKDHMSEGEENTDEQES